MKHLDEAIDILLGIKRDMLRAKEPTGPFFVHGYGKFTVADIVDEIISTILSQETQIADLQYRLEIEKDENVRFHDVLDGNAPDTLTDEEIKKIKEILNAENENDA